jgi:PAS domain S-box-containing protein/diguanylate cyclase (GGDEF)-like protein
MSLFDDSEICRTILESLPTGVCVVDLKKKIVLWSDGAERVTGHLRHEVIGHSCEGEPLVHGDEQARASCSNECPVEQAIKTSHSVEALGILHHKAGHEIPVFIRAVPIHNAHGSIIGAVETFEDQQATNSDHHDDGLKTSACVDGETGLASHAMMQSHLREALGTFTELQIPFGVLCFRMQGLERFRASYGPEAASLLLRVAGRTLESAILRTDFAGRWADDQFLVILNGCRGGALHGVSQRLRDLLANDSIDWWGERRFLPVSVGEAAAQESDTIELLMQRLQKSLEAFSPARARAAASGANQSSGS